MLALTLLTNTLINTESKNRAEGSSRPGTRCPWRHEEPVGLGTNSGTTLDKIHVPRGREWVEVGEGVYSQRQELYILKEKPRSGPRERTRKSKVRTLMKTDPEWAGWWLRLWPSVPSSPS